MNNLINLNFWFDNTPSSFTPSFETGFLYLFALAVVGGLAARINAKTKPDKYQKMLRLRLGSGLITFGILGLIWYFLSFEEIQVFGMRFWFLLLMVGMIIWGYNLYRYFTKTVPALIRQEQSKAEANQYLPRSNRR